MPPRANPTPRHKPYEPKVWGEPLTRNAIAIFYHADRVYLFEGRQLDKDEVIGVLATSQHKGLPQPGSCATIFNKFNDPNDEFTVEYRTLAGQYLRDLEGVVRISYTNYRSNEPQAIEFGIMVHGM